MTHAWRRRYRSNGCDGDWRSVGEQLMGSVRLGERVLCGEETLRSGAVALTLAVLLEGVADGDGSVAEVLPVHGLDGGVGSLETGVVDERETLRVASFRIALDFGGGQDDSEGGECVVEQFLVDFGIEVADENVGTHIEVLLVRGGFVDTDRLAKQFYHVHYFYGVICVVLPEELDESVALMEHGDPIFRHVDVDHGASLHEQLPEKGLIDLVVQAAHVDSGVLVSLRDRTGRHN